MTIILTERESGIIAAIAYKLMDFGRIEAEIVGAAIIDWLAHQTTESASPPRVPLGITGPVLPVECGHGQPITAENAIRTAMVAVEAIGADPRLTDAVNFLQHAQWRIGHFRVDSHREPFNTVISVAELTRLRAENESLKLQLAEEALSYQEAWTGRYHAGIEVAAKVADQYKCGGCGMDSKAGSAILALADKPAPEVLVRWRNCFKTICQKEADMTETKPATKEPPNG